MTEGVRFVEADARGRVPHGWAEAQVLASADFAHGSWLWTHFSGGLNYQAGTPASQPCQLKPNTLDPLQQPCYSPCKHSLLTRRALPVLCMNLYLVVRLLERGPFRGRNLVGDHSS